MIKINIKHNKKGQIYNLLIKGHTIKLNNKLNILCAIVSTITLGGINQLNKKNKENLNIKNNNGFSEINVKNSNIEIQTTLATLVTQLQTVLLYFKKDILIKFELKN